MNAAPDASISTSAANKRATAVVGAHTSYSGLVTSHLLDLEDIKNREISVKGEIGSANTCLWVGTSHSRTIRS